MLYAAHPDLFSKTIANINIDCVGLDQTKVSSALTVIAPPFSRASYITDIFRRVLDYVTLTNNSIMGRVSYGPEITDHDGSSNVFHGRLVPWVDYSDHVFFNSGSVGIPGVMLIDLPFGSHHSQNDKFELLDPTELKRVAFIAAASAYAIASVGPGEAEIVIDLVRSGGRLRLETDFGLAKSLVRGAEKSSLRQQFDSVRNVLSHAFARERQALESTRIFIAGDEAASHALAKALEKTVAAEKEWGGELSEVFRSACLKWGLRAAEQPLTEEKKGWPPWSRSRTPSSRERSASSIPIPLTSTRT